MTSIQLLEIAQQLSLPLKAATFAHGVLAQRGAGKSNLCVCLAEKMYDAGIPWVAVDVKGDWWGIKSSSDGRQAGLKVVVFGGLYADVPISPIDGRFTAEVVVDLRLTCVLDLSDMTKGEQTRFLTDFAERLFHLKLRERFPLHLFLDEADDYIPQKVHANQARCVGIFSKIVKQGRNRGIGVTMATQRSAVLNKDVLSQLDCLFALRTTDPRDRKAIRDWVVENAVQQELLATLPELKDGEGWVWSPHAYRLMVRVRFHRRRTFDSGSTPELDDEQLQPTRLAEVDIDDLRTRMSDMIDKAKLNDPEHLRKQVAELQRQVRDLEARPAVVEEVVVEREIEVVPPGFAGAVSSIEQRVAALGEAVDELVVLRDLVRPATGGTTRLGRADQKAPTPPADRQNDRGDIPGPARPPQAPRSSTAPTANDGTVTGPQRKLLTVLATYGARTKRQLAMQAGYSVKGGGFNNPLGALRSAGLVERGDPIAITQAGVDALGAYEPLPTGRDLLDHWLAQLPGPAARILEAIASRWPDGWAKSDLAAATGYSPVGGGFNNPLGRLRSLELVARGSEIRLTDEFGQAIE